MRREANRLAFQAREGFSGCRKRAGVREWGNGGYLARGGGGSSEGYPSRVSSEEVAVGGKPAHFAFQGVGGCRRVATDLQVLLGYLMN